MINVVPIETLQGCGEVLPWCGLAIGGPDGNCLTYFGKLRLRLRADPYVIVLTCEIVAVCRAIISVTVLMKARLKVIFDREQFAS